MDCVPRIAGFFNSPIVHLIRYSMQFASWKERKFVAKALKPIYQADNADQAAQRLEEFDAGEWGQKNPAIAVARKLAVILHRMCIDDTRFRWSAAAARS